MLTVDAEKRADISDICSHWWVNDGYPQTCLEEAEHLASLTPVRLDLLLSLAPAAANKEEMLVQAEEDKVGLTRNGPSNTDVMVTLFSGHQQATST